MGGMYPDAKTWNPFVGCRFDCVYCGPSFKRQLKRVAGILKCEECRDYTPHYHPERLKKIPSAPIVFVAGTGDISFCHRGFVKEILEAIENHRPRINKTYYLQSKNPRYFNTILDLIRPLQDRIILVTTIETNLSILGMSKAPQPKDRFRDFLHLKYPRKVVTIEPVLDFELYPFLTWFAKLRKQGSLEYVWFGFDSKNCGLPEPGTGKAQMFVNELKDMGIEVRGKETRGVWI